MTVSWCRDWRVSLTTSSPLLTTSRTSHSCPCALTLAASCPGTRLPTSSAVLATDPSTMRTARWCVALPHFPWPWLTPPPWMASWLWAHGLSRTSALALTLGGSEFWDDDCAAASRGLFSALEKPHARCESPFSNSPMCKEKKTNKAMYTSEYLDIKSTIIGLTYNIFIFLMHLLSPSSQTRIKFTKSKCCWCLDCFLGTKRSALTDQRDARKKAKGRLQQRPKQGSFPLKNGVCSTSPQILQLQMIGVFPNPFMGWFVSFILTTKTVSGEIWKLPRSWIWKITGNEQLSRKAGWRRGRWFSRLRILYKIPPTETDASQTKIH